MFAAYRKADAPAASGLEPSSSGSTHAGGCAELPIPLVHGGLQIGGNPAGSASEAFLPVRQLTALSSADVLPLGVGAGETTVHRGHGRAGRGESRDEDGHGRHKHGRRRRSRSGSSSVSRERGDERSHRSRHGRRSRSRSRSRSTHRHKHRHRHKSRSRSRSAERHRRRGREADADFGPSSSSAPSPPATVYDQAGQLLWVIDRTGGGAWSAPEYSGPGCRHGWGSLLGSHWLLPPKDRPYVLGLLAGRGLRDGDRPRRGGRHYFGQPLPEVTGLLRMERIVAEAEAEDELHAGSNGGPNVRTATQSAGSSLGAGAGASRALPGYTQGAVLSGADLLAGGDGTGTAWSMREGTDHISLPPVGPWPGAGDLAQRAALLPAPIGPDRAPWETSTAYRLRRQRQLQTCLKSFPSDSRLWLALAELAWSEVDEVRDTGSVDGQAARRAIGDRVYEQCTAGLDACPRSTELHLLRHRAAVLCHGRDSPAVAACWADVEAAGLASDTRLVLARMDDAAVGGVDGVEQALKRQMHVVLEPSPKQVWAGLTAFTTATLIATRAGQPWRAGAMWQALLEVTVGCPVELQSSSTATRLVWFAAYWDSEALRIGDVHPGHDVAFTSRWRDGQSPTDGPQEDDAQGQYDREVSYCGFAAWARAYAATLSPEALARMGWRPDRGRPARDAMAVPVALQGQAPKRKSRWSNIDDAPSQDVKESTRPTTVATVSLSCLQAAFDTAEASEGRFSATDHAGPPPAPVQAGRMSDTSAVEPASGHGPHPIAPPLHERIERLSWGGLACVPEAVAGRLRAMQVPAVESAVATQTTHTQPDSSIPATSADPLVLVYSSEHGYRIPVRRSQLVAQVQAGPQGRTMAEGSEEGTDGEDEEGEDTGSYSPNSPSETPPPRPVVGLPLHLDLASQGVTGRGNLVLQEDTQAAGRVYDRLAQAAAEAKEAARACLPVMAVLPVQDVPDPSVVRPDHPVQQVACAVTSLQAQRLPLRDVQADPYSYLRPYGEGGMSLGPHPFADGLAAMDGVVAAQGRGQGVGQADDGGGWSEVPETSPQEQAVQAGRLQAALKCAQHAALALSTGPASLCPSSADLAPLLFDTWAVDKKHRDVVHVHVALGGLAHLGLHVHCPLLPGSSSLSVLSSLRHTYGTGLSGVGWATDTGSRRPQYGTVYCEPSLVADSRLQQSVRRWLHRCIALFPGVPLFLQALMEFEHTVLPSHAAGQVCMDMARGCPLEYHPHVLHTVLRLGMDVSGLASLGSNSSARGSALDSSAAAEVGQLMEAGSHGAGLGLATSALLCGCPGQGTPSIQQVVQLLCRASPCPPGSQAVLGQAPDVPTARKAFRQCLGVTAQHLASDVAAVLEGQEPAAVAVPGAVCSLSNLTVPVSTGLSSLLPALPSAGVCSVALEFWGHAGMAAAGTAGARVSQSSVVAAWDAATRAFHRVLVMYLGLIRAVVLWTATEPAPGRPSAVTLLTESVAAVEAALPSSLLRGSGSRSWDNILRVAVPALQGEQTCTDPGLYTAQVLGTGIDTTAAGSGPGGLSIPLLRRVLQVPSVAICPGRQPMLEGLWLSLEEFLAGHAQLLQRVNSLLLHGGLPPIPQRALRPCGELPLVLAPTMPVLWACACQGPVDAAVVSTQNAARLGTLCETVSTSLNLGSLQHHVRGLFAVTTAGAWVGTGNRGLERCYSPKFETANDSRGPVDGSSATTVDPQRVFSGRWRHRLARLTRGYIAGANPSAAIMWALHAMLRLDLDVGGAGRGAAVAYGIWEDSFGADGSSDRWVDMMLFGSHWTMSPRGFPAVVGMRK